MKTKLKIIKNGDENNEDESERDFLRVSSNL